MAASVVLLVLLVLMASANAQFPQRKPMTTAPPLPPRPPPPELFPPPAFDVPRLVAAGAHTLQLEITIPCAAALWPPQCPTDVVWFYKKLNEEHAKYMTSAVTKHSTHVKGTVRFVQLEPNTAYHIQTKPVTSAGHKQHSWYTRSPKAPFTESIIATTCPKRVPPVQELLVHTTGPRWLALSWRPPASSCITRLDYDVRYYATLMPNGNSIPYETVGSFWTNATWMVRGRVVPCYAWPDRQCLLLVDKIDPHKEYTVDMQIRQTVDSKATASRKVSLQAHTTDLAPGSPRDLICVGAEPTVLSLRWRCPLVPGGQLAHANLLVQTVAGAVVHKQAKNVSLRAEYTQRVVALTPNTMYNVSVNFVTTAGKEGPWASLMVWTSPSKMATEWSTERITEWTTDWTTQWTAETTTPPPCRALPVLPGAMQVTGADGHDSEMAVPWWWLVAVAVPLLLLVIAAFFVGRRCRTREQWSRQRLEDQQSLDGVNGGPAPKAATFGGRPRRASDDRAALCLAPGEQPAHRPPAALFEYAEVDLSSGRAWAAWVDGKRSSRASADLYENVANGASHTEQPSTTPSPATPYYAEVEGPTLTQGAPPDTSPYAEVDRPTTAQASPPAYADVGLPQPALPPEDAASTPAAVPQYAQVHKKRPPPPPKPPPAALPQYAQVNKKRSPQTADARGGGGE